MMYVLGEGDGMVHIVQVPGRVCKKSSPFKFLQIPYPKFAMSQILTAITIVSQFQMSLVCKSQDDEEGGKKKKLIIINRQ